ncbi:MAG: phosphoribosylformylglycinamidine synthase [Clostridia bacterium]|nr:phosphoribosylformylglycinamidine synthase [Clostridia bacterium]
MPFCTSAPHVSTAAAGYSSYGNQIGLATGMVDELYHEGYAAKRMEIGAVIAAAPAANVRRERPEDGDAVILLGGRTGRDGCGGATGSSKKHTLSSLETCGAEVQKGNAPEERKLQRLFRDPEACRMIKRCNDFGAGGVSVAVGELADGLSIDLDAVPKKYDGLDGTELAISESQERMAVVVEAADVPRFLAAAARENLEATVVAHVTAEPRLRMCWNGKTIVDLSREFLNSNGAEKHVSIAPAAPKDYRRAPVTDFSAGYRALVSDLNVCSHRGLSERFDSTIGAGTVVMPFGGKNQKTPIQAMIHKISVERGHTDDCSFMSWGYNPYVTEKSPYHGAYLAVVESISRLVAAGASFRDVYLTFQEYFEKPGRDAARWGKPLAALLGAFRAQLDFGIGAIGGKDSMSGSFESLDVPPTLVSFAVTTGKTADVLTPELKAAGNRVYLLTPDYTADGLPVPEALLSLFDRVTALGREGKIVSAWTPTYGGIAEGIYKMAIGNGLGFAYDTALSVEELFAYRYGAFLVESAEAIEGATLVGTVTDDATVTRGTEALTLSELGALYEGRLESVYPVAEAAAVTYPAYAYRAESRVAPAVKCARPRVLIPVFPGTNCEYDTAKVMRDAGAEADIFVINNLTREGIARSVEDFAARVSSSQMIFVPGGFSGGDEPDGSGKFIMAFFKNAAIREAVGDLLDKRDGLMCGVCNGFQALIKLGLVPYGKIIDTDETCPTLTFNSIARHQSKLVRVRVSSNKSPWLAATEVGDVITVPISHGEGRFLASDAVLAELAKNGQIATQYVDLDGNPTSDVRYNPNNSVMAIEGITSPDGRVFGKMGHSERIGAGLYQNVLGKYDMQMFASAVKYFK